MRRLIMIVAFASLVVGGASISVAQNESQTGSEEIGAPAGCGTPVASPIASPDVVPLAATPGLAEGSPVASPELIPASPVACPTPAAGTPAS